MKTWEPTFISSSFLMVVSQKWVRVLEPIGIIEVYDASMFVNNKL